MLLEHAGVLGLDPSLRYANGRARVACGAFSRMQPETFVDPIGDWPRAARRMRGGPVWEVLG